jgi:hypothetical protein
MEARGTKRRATRSSDMFTPASRTRPRHAVHLSPLRLLSRSLCLVCAADEAASLHNCCMLLAWLMADKARRARQICFEILLTKELCVRVVMPRVGGMICASNAIKSTCMRDARAAAHGCRLFWSFDKIKQSARSGIGLGAKASVLCDHRELHRRVNDTVVEVEW